MSQKVSRNRQFLAIVRDDDVLLLKKTDVNYTRLLQKRTHKVVLLCSTDVLFSAFKKNLEHHPLVLILKTDVL